MPLELSYLLKATIRWWQLSGAPSQSIKQGIRRNQIQMPHHLKRSMESGSMMRKEFRWQLVRHGCCRTLKEEYMLWRWFTEYMFRNWKAWVKKDQANLSLLHCALFY